jgi:hypothetical protein
MFGLLNEVKEDSAAEPEKPLCLTFDVVGAVLYPAPGKAVSMYANAKAACLTIAEQWPNLPPPPGAVI